jgi:hypothetical protein
MTILVGNVVRTYATFKDENNDVQDPTHVQVRVKDPSGTVTTYVYGTNVEVVRQSKGVYYIEIDTSGQAGGTYELVWNSSGSYKAAGQTSFEIADTLF